jgi:hypothetical protein
MQAYRLLAAAVLVAATLFPSACNRAQRHDEKTITREIQAKLYQDATLKKRDISIIAQDGVVTLSGQVSTENEKAAAEHLVAGVSGVKRVINQLAVVATPNVTPPAPRSAGAERSNRAGARLSVPAVVPGPAPSP